jgi:SAM-dependent methyltransferase
MNPDDRPVSGAPQFPRHDPASPDFWEVRYRERFSPWDAGGVPACLKEWTAAHTELVSQTVLIPGCGSAWEVAFLDQAGFQVRAIDFSAAAVEAARAHLGPRAALVEEADFFGPALLPASFDLVYERAFLCALPRRLWQDWAARTAELLRPGGLLLGFFFFDDSERGPPFGLKSGELEALLAANFEPLETRIPSDSIAVFAGKERWQVWRKR